MKYLQNQIFLISDSTWIWFLFFHVFMIVICFRTFFNDIQTNVQRQTFTCENFLFYSIVLSEVGFETLWWQFSISLIRHNSVLLEIICPISLLNWNCLRSFLPVPPVFFCKNYLRLVSLFSKCFFCQRKRNSFLCATKLFFKPTVRFWTKKIKKTKTFL